MMAGSVHILCYAVHPKTTLKLFTQYYSCYLSRKSFTSWEITAEQETKTMYSICMSTHTEFIIIRYKKVH